jgi:Ca2+-binding RTX toxin-like protein
MRSVDLNNIFRNYSSHSFYDNIYATFGSVTVKDVLEVNYDSENGLLSFGGYRFEFDVDGNVTGGTVQLVAQYYEGYTDWQISGFGVSAYVIYQAYLSTSTVDEFDIIAAALAGNDTIYLSNYADFVYGFLGSDMISGNGGNDSLYGNSGNDTLLGGSGIDLLTGGANKDSLTGGTGNDTFIFDAVAEPAITSAASDVISDFVRGQDKIKLSAIDAFALSTSNDTFVWKGSAAFSSLSQGEVRYQKFDNTGSTNDYTMVWIDNDRDSGVEMAIRLTGLHNLTASDFIL